MPCGVMMAGGPASTNQASKYPRRGVSTFTSLPAESASGVQSTASTMRGSSTPPGHSKVVCSSLSGYSTGALRRVKRSPSALSANPIRDVCRPISVPPVASSARYSTYTLPSFTTAAGLKVAYSSHRTLPSLIGEKKVAAPFGAIAGFTSGGFSKGPNIQSRPCPRAGPVSEPSRDPSVTSALALLTRDRRATGQARSTSRGSYDYIAAPWHFLNFLPLPQGQGSLRPTPAKGFAAATGTPPPSPGG